MLLALTLHKAHVWASENHCDMLSLSFHSTKCGCQKGQRRSQDWQFGRAGLISCQAVQRVLVWKQTPATITERFLVQPCLIHVNNSYRLQKISLINQLSSMMCSQVVGYNLRALTTQHTPTEHHWFCPLSLTHGQEWMDFFLQRNNNLIVYRTDWRPERKLTDFTIPNGVIWHGTYFLNRIYSH